MRISGRLYPTFGNLISSIGNLPLWDVDSVRRLLTRRWMERVVGVVLSIARPVVFSYFGVICDVVGGSASG
jgi:hypothetical protein